MLAAVGRRLPHVIRDDIGFRQRLYLAHALHACGACCQGRQMMRDHEHPQAEGLCQLSHAPPDAPPAEDGQRAGIETAHTVLCLELPEMLMRHLSVVGLQMTHQRQHQGQRVRCHFFRAVIGYVLHRDTQFTCRGDVNRIAARGIDRDDAQVRQTLQHLTRQGDKGRQQCRYTLHIPDKALDIAVCCRQHLRLRQARLQKLFLIG